MSKDTMVADDGMEEVEVSSGGWMKFINPGDSITGVLQSIWYKEANGNYQEQVVALLSTPEGDMNVGLPHKKRGFDGRESHNDTVFASIMKKLPIGHKVTITLTGFYNSDKKEVVQTNGKTRSGNNFAKNYSFQKSKLPDPSYQSMISVTDIDDTFNGM